MYKNRVIISLITLFLCSSCSGVKSKPTLLKDIYSVDTIILENREWKKITNREHKDLEKIMRSELTFYMNKDFEIYELLDNSYTKLKNSFNSIDSLNKEMIKVVKEMKKKKTTELDQLSLKGDLTFRAILKKDSDSIKKHYMHYDKAKINLKTLFKKNDKSLIFIKEEVEPMKNVLPDLKFKRNQIKEDIEIYLGLINKIILKDQKSEHSGYVIMSSKKIEKWINQLDSFENFLQNIVTIARKESGGFVILRKRDSKPMKYVKRYEKGMENYNLNIEKIHKIVNSF